MSFPVPPTTNNLSPSPSKASALGLSSSAATECSDPFLYGIFGISVIGIMGAYLSYSNCDNFLRTKKKKYVIRV